jgi:hypothetical protein
VIARARNSRGKEPFALGFLCPPVLLFKDMTTNGAAYSRERKTNPDTEFRRYDALTHLHWLLSLPEFCVLLAGLRGEAMALRQAGLPFREYAIDEIERPERDPARRWLGMIRNRVERVLPPGLERAVGLLVRNPKVRLQIMPGRALSPERVARLQSDCLELLRMPYSDPARDERALDARRKRIKRALEAIEPLSPVRSWVVHDGSLGLEVGSGVNVSATGYGAGSQIAVASAVGYPGIGRVAGIDGERVIFDPLRLPDPSSYYRA